MRNLIWTGRPNGGNEAYDMVEGGVYPCCWERLDAS